MLKSADRLLDRLERACRTDDERAVVLSKRVYLHLANCWEQAPSQKFHIFADRRSRELRKSVAGLSRLLRDHWDGTISQEAMQSLCRILRDAEAVARRTDRSAADKNLLRTVRRAFPRWKPSCYAGPDRKTRGDWELVYGSEAYVLAAMGQVADWFGGPVPIRYRLAIPGGRDKPRHWLSSSYRAIADPRALLMPGEWKRHAAEKGPFAPEAFASPIFPEVPVRRAAWWDDHGEQHAFDELGPDLLVSIDIPVGRHLLSFYCVDPDWSRTRHPRQQSILLVDEQREILAAAPAD